MTDIVAPSEPPAEVHADERRTRRRRDVLRRDVLRRHGTEAVLVTAFYTVVACVAMWPMPIKPLAGFYGFGNDNFGGANNSAWVHDALFGPGSPGTNPELQAPFGYSVPLHVFQPMDWLYTIVFGGPRGGVLVQNVQIFVSFVLAGAFAYLLVRTLTGNRPAALVAGFLFTFSPYHLAIGQQYGALSSIQWIPLYLLALIRVYEQPTRRRAVQAGLALALIGLTSFYFLWFTVWFTMLTVAALAVAAAFVQRRRTGALRAADVRAYLGCVIRRGLQGGLVFLALFLPFAVPTLRTLSSDDKSSVAHPIAEAVRYSGKPIMLVLPPLDNPVLGRFSKPIVERNLFDMPVYEQTTYIGIVTALLVVAAILPRRRRRPADTSGAATGSWTRPLLVIGLVVAFAMYLGPYLPLESTYWKNYAHPERTTKLPWIGLVLFTINGTFRFYSRNFVLMSGCLTALAGIGATRVLRRVRDVRAQWAFAAVAILLAGAEFTNAPPARFFEAETPTWVYEVEQLEPDAAIVDYPLAPENSPRSLYYLFWQARHRRATVNPAATTEARAFAATITNPDSPEVAQRLHDAGIDYAVMHIALPPQTTPPYQPGLPDDSVSPELGAKNPWFEQVSRTDDVIIYRIRPPR